MSVPPEGRIRTIATVGNATVRFFRTIFSEKVFIKSVIFKIISKEISRAEHEYMNIHPPPPINPLAMALLLNRLGVKLDENLNWDSHIEIVCKKASAAVDETYKAL